MSAAPCGSVYTFPSGEKFACTRTTPHTTGHHYTDLNRPYNEATDTAETLNELASGLHRIAEALEIGADEFDPETPDEVEALEALTTAARELLAVMDGEPEHADAWKVAQVAAATLDEAVAK